MSPQRLIRRAALRCLLALGVSGGLLVVAAEPVAAAPGYVNEPNAVFGSSGSGDGQFSGPAGVAVDDVSGDVYVVDRGNDRVQKFDAQGSYLAQFDGSDNPSFPAGLSSPSAIAVDNSSGASEGDVYVIDTGDNVIDKLSPSGAFVHELSGFGSAAIGVAVDSSGNVWIAEASGSVRELNGAVANQPIASLTPAFGRSPGIAVDSEDDLYLVRGEPYVAKFDDAGSTLAETVTNCACTTDLTIDQGTDGLLVDQGASIARYGAFGQPYGGAPLQTFGVGGIASSEGVAVDDSTHTVYVSQRDADAIAVFPAVTLPDASTSAASAVHGGSATLAGVVNPLGEEVSSCEFEYGVNNAYGYTAPCAPAPGSGSSPVAVSAQIAGPPLRPGNLLVHYRLRVANVNGVNYGEDRTFETAPVSAPVVIGQPASAVTQFAATLNATLGTGGALVEYRFEYGTTTAYGQVAPIPSAYAPLDDETDPISQSLGGLQAGTTYHYRLVASSPGGTEVAGPDETFTTLAIPAPGVLTGGASGVGVGEATLAGAIDPHGWDTSYAFQYGTSTSYGSSWPTVAVDLGAMEGPQSVIVGVADLLPGTTYHYRLAASNGGGVSYGPDMTFTTTEYPTTVIQEPPVLRTLLVPTGKVTTAPAKGAKKVQKSKRRKRGGKRRKAKHGNAAKRGRSRKDGGVDK